jgi:single-strand DNA-binding protein
VFDTNIVVVGNVLTAPEWRRTASTNALVANFRVASTARRLDKETGRWVDGNHFRVRVNCWRRLAEGVASSVTVGDPVVVAGRLYTRDWNDSEGNLRTTYEMEAVSVGHDLSRGRGRFFRNRPAAATSATETAEAEGQVRGEAARTVAEDEAPAVYGDGVLDGDEPTFEDVPATAPDGFDPTGLLNGGTIEPFDTAMVVPGGGPEPDTEGSDRAPASDPAPDPDGGPEGTHGSAPVPGPGPRPGPGSRSSRRGEPGSAGAEAGDEQSAAAGETPARRPARSRNSRRQPVPA